MTTEQIQPAAPVQNRSLAFWFSEFIADSTYADTTRKGYTAYYRQYEAYLIENGVAEPTVDDFNEENLRVYLRVIKARPCVKRNLFHEGGVLPDKRRSNTIRTTFYPLCAFAKYLVRRKLLADDPTKDLEIPKKQKSVGKRPEAHDEDILAILAATTNEADPATRALDRAIIYTLVDSDMRVGALCNAKVQGYDAYDMSLTVLDKGDKTITYGQSVEACDAINTWLRHRPTDCQHEFLFCSNRYHRVDDAGVIKILRKYAEPLGIDSKSILPHSLRHAAAARLYPSGLAYLIRAVMTIELN